MDRVILVSPFKGATPAEKARNKKYLRRAIRDSIVNHEEAPFAAHELYTRALDDNEIHERALGISLLDEWMPLAGRMVVYADLGISPGMKRDIDRAVNLCIPAIFRYINKHKRRG
jgi:hypothetical protein